MSFSIKLQENLSPLIVADKDIHDVATATGTLRSGTSILDPIIEIDSALESDIIGRVNYAYIELWHRYYYITDVKLDITGLWLFTMHVDVLKTYADDIRAQDAIVARQEEHLNMYLDDGWFMAYQDPLIYTPKFSVDDPFENESYILVISGS